MDNKIKQSIIEKDNLIIRKMEKEISVHLKDEFYIYPEEIEQENININLLRHENYAKKS